MRACLAGAPFFRRGEGGSGRGRWFQIFDDEHFLARPNQAKFATRELLDGSRIVEQTVGLVAQARIFGALTLERRRKLIVLPPGTEHRQETPITHQSIHDEDDRREEDQRASDPPHLRGPLRTRSPASRRCG